jgi:hypothetical protein
VAMIAEPDAPPAVDLPERTRVNPLMLRAAVLAVINQRRENQAWVVRESGVAAKVISALIKHGTCPPPNDVIDLLAWLRLSPSDVRLPGPPVPLPAATAA